MADINTSYKNADTLGRAVFEQIDRYLPQTLLAGGEPELEPALPVLLASSITLAQFSVVALDNNGALVLATASGNKPIGVLAHAAASGASNTTVRGQVWHTGCFNISPDSPLVWDASFNTDALKIAAFRGAPTPTRVVLRHRFTPAS